MFLNLRMVYMDGHPLVSLILDTQADKYSRILIGG